MQGDFGVDVVKDGLQRHIAVGGPLEAVAVVVVEFVSAGVVSLVAVPVEQVGVEHKAAARLREHGMQVFLRQLEARLGGSGIVDRDHANAVLRCAGGHVVQADQLGIAVVLRAVGLLDRGGLIQEEHNVAVDAVLELRCGRDRGVFGVAAVCLQELQGLCVQQMHLEGTLDRLDGVDPNPVAVFASAMVRKVEILGAVAVVIEEVALVQGLGSRVEVHRGAAEAKRSRVGEEVGFFLNR